MKSYPEYTGSRHVYFGKFPAHWREKKLKYLAEINSETLTDKTPPGQTLKYIDISNVTSDGHVNTPHFLAFKNAPSRARRVIRHGDVLVSTVRTYLKAIAHIDWQDEDLIASTGFAVLRGKGLSESRYLYYLLRSEEVVGTIMAHSTGVSYPAISPSDLGKIEVPVPPLPEQRAIARFLDHKTRQIDIFIRKKQQLIELLKEERAAIINQAVTRGIDPDVPMKDSGIEWLGEVPAHWEVTKLKYVARFRGGYAFKSDSYVDEGIPVVRIGDVSDQARIEEMKKVPSRLHDELEEFRIYRGDLLVALTGATIGKSAVFAHNIDALLNQRVGLLRSAGPVVPALLRYLVHSVNFQEHVRLQSAGGAQANISGEQIGDFAVVLPPSEEQVRIADDLAEKDRQIGETISVIERQISLAGDYRTALISEAVTGKIDVRNYPIPEDSEETTSETIEALTA